jgi:hypothetical protein
VEASRKHGSFDTRWACVRKDGASAVPRVSLGAVEVPEALDWATFSARHFGDRGRYDSDARSAYAAYRQGREWRTDGSPRPVGLSLVPPEPVSTEGEEPPEDAGARRLLAAMATVDPRQAHSFQPD